MPVYKCDHCPQTFTSYPRWRTHNRIHLGTKASTAVLLFCQVEDPDTGEICNYPSQSEDGQNQHIKSRHKIPFSYLRKEVRIACRLERNVEQENERRNLDPPLTFSGVRLQSCLKIKKGKTVFVDDGDAWPVRRILGFYPDPTSFNTTSISLSQIEITFVEWKDKRPDSKHNGRWVTAEENTSKSQSPFFQDAIKNITKALADQFGITLNHDLNTSFESCCSLNDTGSDLDDAELRTLFTCARMENGAISDHPALASLLAAEASEDDDEEETDDDDDDDNLDRVWDRPAKRVALGENAGERRAAAAASEGEEEEVEEEEENKENNQPSRKRKRKGAEHAEKLKKAQKEAREIHNLRWKEYRNLKKI